ncbi:hypothetical protein AB0D45_30770 [Streptomyces sp. NPDC048352]|uniref:hypothetical protein n=1 Tax=Streptomyces sp. NPDC048352 TaxID=3154718 RepID=UPI0034125A44
MSATNAAKRLGLALLGGLLAAGLLAAACSAPKGRAGALAPGAGFLTGSPSRFEMSVARS